MYFIIPSLHHQHKSSMLTLLKWSRHRKCTFYNNNNNNNTWLSIMLHAITLFLWMCSRRLSVLLVAALAAVHIFFPLKSSACTENPERRIKRNIWWAIWSALLRCQSAHILMQWPIFLTVCCSRRSVQAAIKVNVLISARSPAALMFKPWPMTLFVNFIIDLAPFYWYIMSHNPLAWSKRIFPWNCIGGFRVQFDK